MVFKQLDNLSLLCGDAHAILEQHSMASFYNEVFINFPEPPVWSASTFNLINKEFLLQVHRVLKPDSCVAILTDDQPYCQTLCKLFAQLPSHFASGFGDEQFITDIPSEYGSSYFDRLWTNGKKTKRFFLRYFKI
eukprot:TRINITY_DN11802_c0_g3_i4.p1 TRINITY_DN11802_c0_g3~~TRINITY_DN11802_c0_g3_i4.p1  ORF type:complete len:135 (-),score=30.37 TRINITY_DN11802_c0_g3_i4:42-446(-)